VDNQTDAGRIKLVGGALCLDYVNTVDGYGCKAPGDYFNCYQDLIDWSRHVGTITAAEAKILSRSAAAHPVSAKRVHSSAIELRTVIYRILTMIVQGLSPVGKDLAVFNDFLAAAMKRSRIVKGPKGFYWDMAGNKSELDWILNPVVRSAADLLISEELGRLKKCGDPTCGWLFLDTSRNRSRRWCDMRDCGNRAKASRFYKKKKRSNTMSSSSKMPSSRSV
jgi:predicted RNA-binding Zn ribbon-like protein